MDALAIFAANYLWLLSALIIGVYFLKQERAVQKKMVIFGILSLALVYILASIAGNLYYDPRPFVVGHFTPLILHDPDNGFPSDHTLITATVAFFALYYNWKIALALGAIAILVGASRVYVGIHHPADIIGSIVIALVATSIAYVILRKFSDGKATK